jgi:hypothetical protein
MTVREVTTLSERPGDFPPRRRRPAAVSQLNRRHRPRRAGRHSSTSTSAPTSAACPCSMDEAVTLARGMAPRFPAPWSPALEEGPLAGPLVAHNERKPLAIALDVQALPAARAGRPESRPGEGELAGRARGARRTGRASPRGDASDDPAGTRLTAARPGRANESPSATTPRARNHLLYHLGRERWRRGGAQRATPDPARFTCALPGNPRALLAQDGGAAGRRPPAWATMTPAEQCASTSTASPGASRPRAARLHRLEDRGAHDRHHRVGSPAPPISAAGRPRCGAAAPRTRARRRLARVFVLCQAERRPVSCLGTRVRAGLALRRLVKGRLGAGGGPRRPGSSVGADGRWFVVGPGIERERRDRRGPALMALATGHRGAASGHGAVALSQGKRTSDCPITGPFDEELVVELHEASDRWNGPGSLDDPTDTGVGALPPCQSRRTASCRYWAAKKPGVQGERWWPARTLVNGGDDGDRGQLRRPPSRVVPQ